jgi:hypothetical protein
MRSCSAQLSSRGVKSVHRLARSFAATEYACLLRGYGQRTYIEHEQRIHRLFSQAEWVRLLREVGFQPETTRDRYGRDIFVARRPTDSRHGADQQGTAPGPGAPGEN